MVPAHSFSAFLVSNGSESNNPQTTIEHSSLTLPTIKPLPSATPRRNGTRRTMSLAAMKSAGEILLSIECFHTLRLYFLSLSGDRKPHRSIGKHGGLSELLNVLSALCVSRQDRAHFVEPINRESVFAPTLVRLSFIACHAVGLIIRL